MCDPVKNAPQTSQRSGTRRRGRVAYLVVYLLPGRQLAPLPVRTAREANFLLFFSSRIYNTILPLAIHPRLHCACACSPRVKSVS